MAIVVQRLVQKFESITTKTLKSIQLKKSIIEKK